METLQLLSEENPIPPKRSSKVDQRIKRMRWKAFFDMDGSEENIPETYVLKLLNSQPKPKKLHLLRFMESSKKNKVLTNKKQFTDIFKRIYKGDQTIKQSFIIC